MTRTLKKQLSSLSTPALLALLLIPFVGFFIVITFSDRYFLFLVFTAFMSLAVMLPFHFHLRRKQGDIELTRQEFLERTNLAEAELLREQLAIEALHQKIFNFSQLKGLTEKLGMSFSLSEACQTIGMEVSKLFVQEDVTVILYLLHSGTGELSLVSAYGGEREVNVKAKRGDLYDHWVEKNMKPLLLEDSKSDFRFDQDKVGADEVRPVRSLMSVPLAVGNKPVGILRLDSAVERQFSTDDIRLLSVVGDLVAVAIENVQLYERVEDLAIRDSLTGLFLRRYFVERISQEMSRELRRKKELSLLMIDLDKFKHYNDNFGHSAGDIVLKTVAMILSYMFDKPGNMVCRYGGEEFAILLPDCSRDEAWKLAEELRKKIESQTIILRRQTTHITASIGVATFPRDAQLREELIQQADTALYDAKKRGRNQVCLAKEK